MNLIQLETDEIQQESLQMKIERRAMFPISKTTWSNALAVAVLDHYTNAQAVKSDSGIL